MAILRAMDGNFYEIPDEQVAKYKIPQEKLKEKLGSQAQGAEGPPPEGGGDRVVGDRRWCRSTSTMRVRARAVAGPAHGRRRGSGPALQLVELAQLAQLEQLAQLAQSLGLMPARTSTHPSCKHRLAARAFP